MKSSKPAVGPLDVLEDEDRRALRRRCARRTTRHAANSTSRPPEGGGLEAEQRERARLDPAAARPDLAIHCSTAAAIRSRVVASSSAFGEPGPAAHHLAKGPERDSLAVRRRATAVPVDRLDDAVDVLLELPRQAALADARRAR